MGTTGTGKSTTAHYLAGSDMVEFKIQIEENSFMYHIEPVEIKNPYLKKITTSPYNESETRFISPVLIEFKDVPGTLHTEKSIWLCDTPGWFDNRGPEIDISNGLGVIKAIQGCKSVMPVILIS